MKRIVQLIFLISQPILSITNDSTYTYIIIEKFMLLVLFEIVSKLLKCLMRQCENSSMKY